MKNVLSYHSGGESGMKLSSKVTKVLYSLALVMAGVAVNSTCFVRYHQEKMDSQLDALKKYRD